MLFIDKLNAVGLNGCSLLCHPMQLSLKVGNHPAGPGPQAMADLRQASWSGQRHPAFMGSPGIWTGISSGLVVMSDAAVVCGDYEEFED